jgi:hypothetical protein
VDVLSNVLSQGIISPAIINCTKPNGRLYGWLSSNIVVMFDIMAFLPKLIIIASII